MEKVDMITSGYEWTCPKCEMVNHEIEIMEEVLCGFCSTTFKTDGAEHAYP